MRTLIAVLALDLVVGLRPAVEARFPDAPVVAFVVIVLVGAAAMGARLDMSDRNMISAPAYVLSHLALVRHLAAHVGTYDGMYAAGVAGEIAAWCALLALPLAIIAAPAGELLKRGRA